MPIGLDWINSLLGYGDDQAPAKKPVPSRVPTHQAPKLETSPTLWDTIKQDAYKAAQKAAAASDYVASGLQDFTSHFTPSYVNAASANSMGGGGIARELAYRTGAYQKPGESNDAYRQRIAQAEQNREAAYAKTPFANTPSGVLGQAVGSLLGGIDPTWIYGPGEGKALTKIASMGGLQGVAGVTRQQINRAQGVQNTPVDWRQAADDAALGVLLQGGFEGAKGLGRQKPAIRQDGLTPEALAYLKSRTKTPPPEDIVIDFGKSEPSVSADANINPASNDNAIGLVQAEPDFRTRREKITDASKYLADQTKDGGTATTQPFPDEESDYYRFRHVTKDGQEVNGTYTYDPEKGVIDNFSINGEGANSTGPSIIRQIGRDLSKEHPEAHTLRAYRTTGARPNEEFVDIPLKTSKTEPEVNSTSPGTAPVPGEPELTPAARIWRKLQSDPEYELTPEESKILNDYNQETGDFFERQMDEHGYKAATDEFLHNGRENGIPKEFPVEDVPGTIPGTIHPDSPVYAFDAEGNLVGRYRNLAAARRLKPGHSYADDFNNWIDGATGDHYAHFAPRILQRWKDLEAPPQADDLIQHLKNMDGMTPEEKESYIQKLRDTLRNLNKDEEGAFKFPKFGRKAAEDAHDEAKGAQPDAVRKIATAIQNARPIRNRQESMYSKARSERVAKAADIGRRTQGPAGFEAEKSALAGELPKATFESVAPDLTEQDIIDLFEHVKNHPAFQQRYFDSITARHGLEKLLGAHGGVIPTQKELTLLEEVFPKSFIDTILSKKSFREKLGEAITNAVNLPRTLMSSMDFSAPFRQGFFLMGDKRWRQAFPGMFKQFASQKAFDDLMEEIRSRPNANMYGAAGLDLTGMGGEHLSNREEAFASAWGEKLPIAGMGVRASERAFQGFLNKLRADVFDDLVNKSMELGVDFNRNPQALKDIGNFVNMATGRGSLGKLNSSMPALSMAFFSPRLMASRIGILNPQTYLPRWLGGKYVNPAVRQAALTNLLKVSSIALTVLGLAKLAGAEVADDPRNSDFGKIKIGDTRFDMLGGFGQYITLAARLLTSESISSNSGKTQSLDTNKYGKPNDVDVIGKFLRNKESPFVSFAHDYLSGSDTNGKPFDLTDEALRHATPMLSQDIADAYERYKTGKEGAEHFGTLAGAAVAVPSAFGIGVQTYEPKKPKWAEGLSDDTMKEIESLHPTTNPDAPIVTSVPHSIKIGKETMPLSETEQKDFQNMTTVLFDSEVKELSTDPDYNFMTDDEKRTEIRKRMSKARKDAREMLFPDAEDFGGDE